VKTAVVVDLRSKLAGKTKLPVRSRTGVSCYVAARHAPIPVITIALSDLHELHTGSQRMSVECGHDRVRHQIRYPVPPPPQTARGLTYLAVACLHERWDRRAFLGMLGVGLAAAVTGCTRAIVSNGPTRALRIPVRGTPPPSSDRPSPHTGGQDAGPRGSQPERLSPPVAEPGGVLELRSGPLASVATRQIALTVDDGFCASCVAGYVAFAQRSGVHLTFSPNGLYAHAWEPHSHVLAPLIDAGQVQIMNHTFTHSNLIRLPAPRVRDELARNETWIARTFATTARPYYRPPFGYHNPRVDAVAAEVGFDRVVMWDGTYSDSQLVTPQFLMDQARKYLHPGVILLGHANHPTVLGLFDQITQLIHDRSLTPSPSTKCSAPPAAQLPANNHTSTLATDHLKCPGGQPPPSTDQPNRLAQ
jgi:peptidoglycan/xylan/chitin deacetylase (PgdA/CDA1 family)